MSQNTRKSAVAEKKQQAAAAAAAQKEANEETITPGIQDKLVNDCVLVILALGRNKSAFKKSEVFKKVGVERKHQKIIMELTRNKMREILGMDILDLESKSQQCLLVSSLPRALKVNTSITSTQDLEYTLLMVILAGIMMKDEDLVEEKEIKDMLQQMSVNIENDTPHSILGNPKKLIKKFIQQHYLRHTAMPGNPQHFGFGWGPRALHEMNKIHLLQAVSEVYGVEPTTWEVVYNKLVPTEEPEPAPAAVPETTEQPAQA